MLGPGHGSSLSLFLLEHPSLEQDIPSKLPFPMARLSCIRYMWRVSVMQRALPVTLATVGEVSMTRQSLRL